MTGSMVQRKSKLPEANKMARMLRSGRTTGDLAVRYGINSNVIAMQLTANGWDASTGKWVGGDKKDYAAGAPLSARGDGPGETRHYVGGGDNPNVVPTVARPYPERRPQPKIVWPVRDTPAAVPAKSKPRLQPSPAWGRAKNSKISPEQEVELAKRYLALESTTDLARAFSVNERTVRKRLHRLGVPMRSHSEALRVRYARRRIETVAVTPEISQDVA